jgi:hypothetical protein
MKRGSGCSKSGNLYEITVYNVVKNCVLNNMQFNTQPISLLGGSSCNNDIECNLDTLYDVPIEIKKENTPDWMQCSLKYNIETKKWICNSNNKIPDTSKQIFQDLLESTKLFNGKVPPFMKKTMSHAEWINIKKKEKDTFKDSYIQCPPDTIKQLYSGKGCKYIQISNKGLYHLGDDICKFNVPEFICNQRLRIRTKIHRKNNKVGLCSLSVIIACQPTNIKKLVNSQYSLDNIHKLPLNLLYNPTICNN